MGALLKFAAKALITSIGVGYAFEKGGEGVRDAGEGVQDASNALVIGLTAIAAFQAVQFALGELNKGEK